MTTTALASSNSGSLVFVVFVTFVTCALFVTVLVTTDRATPRDFYVGDGRLTPIWNGIAIFGVYLSVETLFGAPSRIALTGYDGIGYLMGPIVAIVVVLLLIAEPYHSTSRYTIGDSLGRRLRARSVHLAAGIATLGTCLVYLIAHMVGAGALAAPILGLDGTGAQEIMVSSLGLLVIVYAALGGMRATTAMQVVKGVLLLGGGGVTAVLVMSRVGWDPAILLSQAADHSGLGDAFLEPGTSHTDTAVDKLDSLSVQLAVFIGAAGMPHVLMRLRAVSTARAARRSVEIAAWLTLAFCLMAGLIGFGAATLLGRAAIITDNPTGNTAVLMLAEFIGGAFLITLISCIAFATVLAVVSGLVLTASAALAHDIYQVGLMNGKASEKSELLVARVTLVLVGLTAIGLSTYAQAQSISFLVGLALAIAGSAILPAVLYNMYWRRFTTRGALWSVYGGLLSSVLLVVFSPVLSGSPTSLLPDLDFAVFPLTNPAVASIPLGFLLGWLGSVLDSRKSDGMEYAETEAGVLADLADSAPEASPRP
ncbi:cation acetate symporter [Streptomyces sp. NPDC094149]|uniref:solute symporter family protein n=1 Tax=Streptomyces sp. NPDC094149 TaxID=3155079 RepID=UPI00331D84F9